jgi:hypothetical protein
MIALNDYQFALIMEPRDAVGMQSSAPHFSRPWPRAWKGGRSETEREMLRRNPTPEDGYAVSGELHRG